MPSRGQVWLQILLGPARFWAGVAILLFVVGTVCYTYGAWYASVLTMDAVPVREIRERSSWPGQFAYRDEAEGLRIRVRRPAPDLLSPQFSIDVLADVDLTGGGYSNFPEALRVAKTDEEEGEEEQEQKPFDRSEYLKAMRETGLLTGEEQARGRSHTVVVDEFESQDEARAAAQRLRELGRDVALEEVRGDDGAVSYRLQSGSFPSIAEAEAYQRELQAAGLMEGGGGSVGESSTDPGASPPPSEGQQSPPPTTDPPPPTDPVTPDPPPDTPPPADPPASPPADPIPPPEDPGGGRALGDL